MQHTTTGECSESSCHSSEPNSILFAIGNQVCVMCLIDLNSENDPEQTIESLEQLVVQMKVCGIAQEHPVFLEHICSNLFRTDSFPIATLHFILTLSSMF